MAEGEENKEKRCNTMQMNGFSRDVLHKLEQISNKNEEEEEGDIELSLGLSLNGRFGVDPQRVKRLKRSSSVANVVFGSSNENCNSNNGRCSFSYVPIVRTCSLPVEAEEECRKRKELQSLRRLEAKRKRMEKLQNNVNKVVVKEENGYNGVGNNSLQLSQGSIGSQGSGSSGISDFGSQGPGNTTGTNTPTIVKSEHEHEQKQVATQPEHTSEKSPSICANASKEAKEMFKNFMLNMPCVSTKGDGPNGKKIEGFLYRYQKGEEVKIVCVCHGNFLSPAEFIKHGGGGDVENPLRHIVVSPAPLLG